MALTAEQRARPVLLDDKSARRFLLLLSASLLLHSLFLLPFHFPTRNDAGPPSVLTVDIVSPDAVPVLPPPLPGAYPSRPLPEAEQRADAAAVPPPSPLAPADIPPDAVGLPDEAPPPMASAPRAEPLPPSAEAPETATPAAPFAETAPDIPPETLAEAAPPAVPVLVPPPPAPGVPVLPETGIPQVAPLSPASALAEVAEVPAPGPDVPPPDGGIPAFEASASLPEGAVPPLAWTAPAPEPPALAPLTGPPAQGQAVPSDASMAEMTETALILPPPGGVPTLEAPASPAESAPPSFVQPAPAPEPPALPLAIAPPAQQRAIPPDPSMAEVAEMAIVLPPSVVEAPQRPDGGPLRMAPPLLEESTVSPEGELKTIPPPAGGNIPDPAPPSAQPESAPPPPSIPVAPESILSSGEGGVPPIVEPTPSLAPPEDVPVSVPSSESPMQLAALPDGFQASTIAEAGSSPDALPVEEVAIGRLAEADARPGTSDVPAPSAPVVPPPVAEAGDRPRHVAEDDRPADRLTEPGHGVEAGAPFPSLAEATDPGLRLREARPGSPPTASRRQTASAARNRATEEPSPPPAQPARSRQLAALPTPPLPAPPLSTRPEGRRTFVVPGLDCGWVEAQVDERSGAVSLSGHVSSDAERSRVAERMDGHPAPASIRENRVAVLPGPGCRVAERLRRAGIPMSGEMERQLFQGDRPGRVNATVFRPGERIMIELQTPSFPAYVYVDHYDVSGTVRHLYPGGGQSRRLDPGQALQIGNTTAGPLVAGPPFGLEAVVAVGASAPLFSLPPPEVEPAPQYLARLGTVLERRRAADPAFRAEFFIRYIEKTP